MLIQKLKELFITTTIKRAAKNHLLDSEELARINEMFRILEAGASPARPSQYWVQVNKMNMAQLQEHGYDNFKKTIALTYFTFVRITPWDAQIRFLVANLPISRTIHCLRFAISAEVHDFFSSFNWIQSVLYNFLTYASWEYVLRNVSDRALLSLSEPTEGSPAQILYKGKLISQDLANSNLEIAAIIEAAPNLKEKQITVLELGAGYGRDAFVLLSVFRNVKYIVVDIPPALWVSECYLRQQFPRKRIFGFRNFSEFETVEKEFQESDIAFILATQIALLPPAIADLIITISSLHEMRFEQNVFYFREFDRLLKLNGLFYFKQWKKGHVLFENTIIRKEDYPIPRSWNALFDRTASIHTKFFESMYKKGGE